MGKDEPNAGIGKGDDLESRLMAEPPEAMWLCGSVVAWRKLRGVEMLVAWPRDDARDKSEEQVAKVLGAGIGFAAGALSGIGMPIVPGLGGALALWAIVPTVWAVARQMAEQASWRAVGNTGFAWGEELRSRGADQEALDGLRSTIALGLPSGFSGQTLEAAAAIAASMKTEGTKARGEAGAFSKLCAAAVAAVLWASPSARAALRAQRASSEALRARGAEWGAKVLPGWMAMAEASKIRAEIEPAKPASPVAKRRL